MFPGAVTAKPVLMWAGCLRCSCRHALRLMIFARLNENSVGYSTVTDFAKFLGLSGSQPLSTAIQ
jgi:hypothetical protein